MVDTNVTLCSKVSIHLCFFIEKSNKLIYVCVIHVLKVSLSFRAMNIVLTINIGNNSDTKQANVIYSAYCANIFLLVIIVNPLVF